MRFFRLPPNVYEAPSAEKNIAIIFRKFFNDDVQKFKLQTTGTDTFHFRMSQNNIDICLTVSKTCISIFFYNSYQL